MDLKTVLFSLALTLSSASLRAQEVDPSIRSNLPNETWSNQQLITQYSTEHRPLNEHTNWNAVPINPSAVESARRIDIRFAQDKKSIKAARLCIVLTVALVATSLAVRHENRDLSTGLAVGGLAVSLTGFYLVSGLIRSN